MTYYFAIELALLSALLVTRPHAKPFISLAMALILGDRDDIRDAGREPLCCEFLSMTKSVAASAHRMTRSSQCLAGSDCVYGTASCIAATELVSHDDDGMTMLGARLHL